MPPQPPRMVAHSHSVLSLYSTRSLSLLAFFFLTQLDFPPLLVSLSFHTIREQRLDRQQTTSQWTKPRPASNPPTFPAPPHHLTTYQWDSKCYCMSSPLVNLRLRWDRLQEPSWTRLSAMNTIQPPMSTHSPQAWPSLSDSQRPLL